MLKDHNGETALDCAVKWNQQECINLITAHIHALAKAQATARGASGGNRIRATHTAVAFGGTPAGTTAATETGPGVEPAKDVPRTLTASNRHVQPITYQNVTYHPEPQPRTQPTSPVNSPEMAELQVLNDENQQLNDDIKRLKRNITLAQAAHVHAGGFKGSDGSGGTTAVRGVLPLHSSTPRRAQAQSAPPSADAARLDSKMAVRDWLASVGTSAQALANRGDGGGGGGGGGDNSGGGRGCGTGLKGKVVQIQAALEIDPATPLLSSLAQANKAMGLPANGSLPDQAIALMAALGI